VTTLVARSSGAGPSAGRGDTISAGDFGMVGGIGLGTGNSRGTSCDTVSHGLDNGTLCACDLSASTIGSGGPALRVLGCSGSSAGTIGSNVSSTGVGDGGRSLS
jgi:hypothetical protein